MTNCFEYAAMYLSYSQFRVYGCAAILQSIIFLYLNFACVRIDGHLTEMGTIWKR